MSDDTISISELKKLREGWPESIEPVLDVCGDWHGQFDHFDNEHEGEGYLECHSWDMENAELFAKLIAAEHNALPVLLDVVKAALSLQNRYDFSENARKFHYPEMRKLIAALSRVRQ